MISYLDKQVGIIWDVVKKQGLEENTIIMFSSDNGATFVKQVDAPFFESVGKLRGLKMDVYEGGIRIPMIAYWKNKIKAGQTTDHISAQYDVMATCAELLGVKPTYPTDGISFYLHYSIKTRKNNTSISTLNTPKTGANWRFGKEIGRV
jgi:arylsulfatase A